MSAAQAIFHEEQRFAFLRLRVMLALPPAALSVLLVWQVVLGHPWGMHPMSNGGLIALTVFLWLIYVQMVTVRLVTDVASRELSVGLRWVWRARRIALSDIRAAKVVSFQPIRDFGGYGIRWTRKGRAYIAAGTRGVRLELNDSRVVIIGSAHPEELLQALGRF